MSLLFDALKRAQESDEGAEKGDSLRMDRSEPEAVAREEQGDSQFIDLSEPEAIITPVDNPAEPSPPKQVVSPPVQEAALLAAQSIFSATARQSRRIVTLAAGGLILLLLAGGGGYWYYQRTIASFASQPAIVIAPPASSTVDLATPPPEPPAEAEPPATPEAASGGLVPPTAVSSDPQDHSTPPANDPGQGTSRVAAEPSVEGADAHGKPAPAERVTAAASTADKTTVDRVPIRAMPAKPGRGEGSSAQKPQSQRRPPRQSQQREQPEKGKAQTQSVTENSGASHIRLSVSTDPLGDGYQALSEGRLDDAERHYLEVVAKRPQERDALLGLAVIAHRKLQTERATDLYRQVLREDPGNATATAALVSLSVQVDPVAAESRLKQLLDQQPTSSELYHALGRVLARQKRWGEAQQAFFQAFTLEPDNAQYAYNLAVALDRLHKPSAALSYYEKSAQTLKPGDAALNRDTIQRRVQELRSSIQVDRQ